MVEEIRHCIATGKYILVALFTNYDTPLDEIAVYIIQLVAEPSI